MDEPEETRPLRLGGAAAPSERRGPGPGAVFAERYQIEAELGCGGFGTVFAAHDPVLGRRVAIKILSRGSDDPVVLARFLQEARSAAALDSEHVVSVHEVVVRPDGAPFLVMELLRGADLHDELVDRGTLPVAEAVDLVLEAALGLAHAHARGIVHRDLKPRNLFLARRADGTRVVKVLDFGIARWATSEVTATGAAMGTPRYMAPEQLRSSRTVDARADIWSLGVVLYELVTGAPIVDAATPLQFAAQILVAPHVPLRVRQPTLPARLALVVDRCLAKDPADRFEDLSAFAAALAELAGAARDVPARIAHVLRPPAGLDPDPTVSHGVATRSASVAVPHRRRRAIAAGVIVVASIAGVVIWRGGRDQIRPRSTPVVAATPGVPTAPAPARPVVVTAPPTPTATAAPPTPTATAAPPTPTATAAPPTPTAPTETARRPVRRPPTSTTPTAAEVAAITDWCIDNGAAGLEFLVPGQGGGRSYFCGAVAGLGCARLIRRCGAEAVTATEKSACRDVIAGLRRSAVCR